MWYRRREQPVRLSSWYAMNGIVNMVSSLPCCPRDTYINAEGKFGSLIAFGLGHINSSIFAPYQVSYNT